MVWKRLSGYVRSLEESSDILRIPDPVDVDLEAGCFADRFVKRGGPAIKFEQPRLPDGSISEFPLLMNLYGTTDRTYRALGVEEPKEIGEGMVALMKPDVGGILKAPWTGVGLAMRGMSMAPRKVSKGACQQVVMEEPDVTRLPIPRTWPEDAGPFMTLPLVVTADPNTGEHNMGMYRSQVFGPREVGLHWQAHKHGADHADAATGRMPVAICLGGPPGLTFSAISPLPDNLSEYEFAGLLGGRRLPITKCATSDLWVPAECDVVIEGYTVPGETRLEGPFGDHFGYYSLAEPYPVMHVTRITHRRDAMVPMTIVGTPPMEDGYLGEAIGDAFLPVLRFQHRDLVDLFLPLETGFHNLAIVASKQRYPRQARKTALGLLGAGQLMFQKVTIVVDENHPVKDLDALLDAIDYRVHIPEDLVFLRGMVADTLAHAAPWDNIHDKLIIDATTPPEGDPHSKLPEQAGCPESLEISASAVKGVVQARMLRSSMLVVTTNIEGGPKPESSMEMPSEEGAARQREVILEICDAIWSLEAAHNLRWLFITDDDAYLASEDWRRHLLWQLFCRFDVGRDLHFDKSGGRVAWDATAPIPSNKGPIPVRRWPGVTIHDPEVAERVDAWLTEGGY
ncbi:MAG: UbiD family decarboxylase [Candidatus Thalassarchaeum sp.]|jgi:4-hydroxy-3-polyprenylbenzoate decarboxylase|nr:UbiD family decarboxylase [Candidatus Thalassarchaeum sp.]MDP6921060.1 UbiD family decarboxylase [Candidatus Thalassarchaeum sp.]MEC8913863.1 UbiD family decarboxylase [Candidatus Thermoplasmatota archaeon]MEE2606784.1 UbiD family decarboxylase [Candidatus Thermoplasmatota archaeon]